MVDLIPHSSSQRKENQMPLALVAGFENLNTAVAVEIADLLPTIIAESLAGPRDSDWWLEPTEVEVRAIPGSPFDRNTSPPSVTIFARRTDGRLATLGERSEMLKKKLGELLPAGIHIGIFVLLCDASWKVAKGTTP